MPIIKHLTSAMSSISALQGTCNTMEKRLTAKLTALAAAKDSAGVKVTEATFTEHNGNVNELGKLEIKTRTAGSLFDGDAWILTVRTDVSVFRT